MKERFYEESDEVKYIGFEYEFIQCDPADVVTFIGKDGWIPLATTLTILESTTHNVLRGPDTATHIVYKVGFWRQRPYYSKKESA